MGVLPAQVALEIILGFDDAAIDDELVTRCRSAFRAWVNGLFSLPINLPGFGKPPSAANVVNDDNDTDDNYVYD